MIWAWLIPVNTWLRCAHGCCEDCQEMIRLWYCATYLLACYSCRCWALRWSTVIENVKQVRADGMRVVKDGREWSLGPIDRGSGTDRRWITLDNVSKQVYMRRRHRLCWPSPYGGWRSQARARGHGDWEVKDKWSHTSRSFRKHSGYTIPAGYGGLCLEATDEWIARFGPQNLGWSSRRHVVSLAILHWGEAFSWKARGHWMHGSQLG
jgi:hypothetical protein